MGGAERTARKRKQQQATNAKVVSQARGSDRNKVIIAVVGVVVLAAVVVGGVLWTNSSKNATKDHTIAALQSSLPGVREGTTVVSALPAAKKTIDVYADFICPACGQFQQLYGKQIEDQTAAGALRVNYHMLPMLNRASNPPGYSGESANASLCAADQGKFMGFHDSLFAQQPKEGTRGYDKGQLIQLGKDLGIADPAFEPCVNNNTYNAQIDADFQRTSSDPAMQQDHGNGPGFSTPTVTANGKVVDVGDKDWLTKVLAG